MVFGCGVDDVDTSQPASTKTELTNHWIPLKTMHCTVMLVILMKLDLPWTVQCYNALYVHNLTPLPQPLLIKTYLESKNWVAWNNACYSNNNNNVTISKAISIKTKRRQVELGRGRQDIEGHCQLVKLPDKQKDRWKAKIASKLCNSIPCSWNIRVIIIDKTVPIHL